MTAMRAEGESADSKLPAKLAAHPSVRAVLARRRAGDAANPPAVIDAAWLRELCLAAGAMTLPRSAWTTPTWRVSASTCSPRYPAPAA